MNICPFSFFLNHTPAAMNRESVKASRQEHHANNCHWPSPLSSETKVLTKWPTAVLFLFLSVSQHNARDHFRRSESWNFMQWRFLIFVRAATSTSRWRRAQRSYPQNDHRNDLESRFVKKQCTQLGRKRFLACCQRSPLTSFASWNFKKLRS